MAKKPRYIQKLNSLVEVSNRTVGSRFLLKPSSKARELMAGVLAHAARKYPAQVIFYVFLSTHFHLYLIVESLDQLADFMKYLDSNLFHKVELEARIEREAAGKRVLGRKAVLKKLAHYVPPLEKRSPVLSPLSEGISIILLGPLDLTQNRRAVSGRPAPTTKDAQVRARPGDQDSTISPRRK